MAEENTPLSEEQKRELEKEYAKQQAYNRHIQTVAGQNKDVAKRMILKKLRREHDDALELEGARQQVRLAKQEAGTELRERKELLTAQRETARADDLDLIGGGPDGDLDMIMDGSSGKRREKGQDFDMIL